MHSNQRLHIWHFDQLQAGLLERCSGKAPFFRSNCREIAAAPARTLQSPREIGRRRFNVSQYQYLHRCIQWSNRAILHSYTFPSGGTVNSKMRLVSTPDMVQVIPNNWSVPKVAQMALDWTVKRPYSEHLNIFFLLGFLIHTYVQLRVFSAIGFQESMLRFQATQTLQPLQQDCSVLI